MAASSIKNLIFDLGGVILDLSVDKTLHAFSRLSGIEPGHVKKLFISSPEFEYYEKGQMNDAEFRDFVRKVYKLKTTDEAIDNCWNQMLLGLPLMKLELLNELKKYYSVYLLSNTNGIHLHHINEVILKNLTGQNNLDIYFHKAFYSHRMGKRKPDAEIFLQVLEDQNLLPGETLFLDDNSGNIDGATQLGIQTVYVVNPDIMTTTSSELLKASLSI